MGYFTEADLRLGSPRSGPLPPSPPPAVPPRRRRDGTVVQLLLAEQEGIDARTAERHVRALIRRAEFAVGDAEAAGAPTSAVIALKYSLAELRSLASSVARPMDWMAVQNEVEVRSGEIIERAEELRIAAVKSRRRPGMSGIASPDTPPSGVFHIDEFDDVPIRFADGRTISLGQFRDEIISSSPNGKPLVVEIPSGWLGSIATLGAMSALAIRDAQNPEFVDWARAMVRRVPDKDYVGELEALYDAVKENVRYVKDPRMLEHVSSPLHTLTVSGQEDCDGHSTLLSGLALALDHGSAHKIVRGDSRRPDSFSHVYAALGARTPEGVVWKYADTTQKSKPFGWEPPPERTFGSATFIVADP